MATEEVFEARTEHIRFMDKLCKKLHRSKRIRVTKREVFSHPRRHPAFSIKEVGDTPSRPSTSRKG